MTAHSVYPSLRDKRVVVTGGGRASARPSSSVSLNKALASHSSTSRRRTRAARATSRGERDAAALLQVRPDG